MNVGAIQSVIENTNMHSSLDSYLGFQIFHKSDGRQSPLCLDVIHGGIVGYAVTRDLQKTLPSGYDVLSQLPETGVDEEASDRLTIIVLDQEAARNIDIHPFVQTHSSRKKNHMVVSLAPCTLQDGGSGFSQMDEAHDLMNCIDAHLYVPVENGADTAAVSAQLTLVIATLAECITEGQYPMDVHTFLADLVYVHSPRLSAHPALMKIVRANAQGPQRALHALAKALLQLPLAETRTAEAAMLGIRASPAELRGREIKQLKAAIETLMLEGASFTLQIIPDENMPRDAMDISILFSWATPETRMLRFLERLMPSSRQIF